MTSSAHLPDEELLESTTAAGEDHLRTCRLCRRRRDVQQGVRTAIRGLERVAPASDDARRILDRAAAPSSRRRWYAFAAAAVLLMVATVTAVVRSRRADGRLPAPLRDELVLDHLHYAPIAQPAQVASSDPRVVATGLEERLGRPVVVPSWEATTLIGGRSCRIQSEWVPLVLYERAGRRISLFEIPSAHVSAPTCERAQDGVSVCAAPSARGGAFVAVAALPPHEISRLLALVHDG